jgi:preprotein translocase subunit SecD
MSPDANAATPRRDNGDVKRLLSVVCIAGLAVACSSSPTSSATPSATSQSLLVVYTKWVPDPNAVAGPEPGSKPAFTGLTSHDIQKASASIDSMGTSWVVYVTFTAHGADLFKQLTRANVAACPGDAMTVSSANCAGRFLTSWINLTQSDIDKWDDAAYADKVSQPFDLTCLAHTTAATACPKLLTNAITLQEIDGGSAMIGGVLTQQTATQLADAINATSHT